MGALSLFGKHPTSAVAKAAPKTGIAINKGILQKPPAIPSLSSVMSTWGQRSVAQTSMNEIHAMRPIPNPHGGSTDSSLTIHGDVSIHADSIGSPRDIVSSLRNMQNRKQTLNNADGP